MLKIKLFPRNDDGRFNAAGFADSVVEGLGDLWYMETERTEQGYNVFSVDSSWSHGMQSALDYINTIEGFENYVIEINSIG